MSMLLAACATNNKTYRIGVSQCGTGEWRDKVNHEMLAAQHLYECDVKVSIACAYDDTRHQIQQIDSLADSGIELLVVAPNESAPVAEAIERTRQKGIPVIYFDRKAETQDYTAFIGGNNVSAGQTVGSYIADMASGIADHQPVVLEITAAMSSSPARERHDGFQKAMQEHPELKYICINSDWTSQSAYQVAKTQISSGLIPDMIFCHNDGMTTGVYKAIDECGQKGRIKLFGIDGMADEGIKYVLDGQLDGTYVYPTHGDEIIRLALNILTGQPYERDNAINGMIVTPENANIISLNSRELMKQNADLIIIHDKLDNYFGLYNSQHKMLMASLISILVLLIGLLLTWLAVKQTRKAHRKMKALNEEQTLFYTNASHQLKTPLTLIAGPVNKLKEDTTLTETQQELLAIMERNIAQLETVTNSVLNFQKEQTASISDDTAAESFANQEKLHESRLSMMMQEDTEELPTVLIVDDNEDMRRYLRTLLADKFYVLDAPDGQAGLKLARDIVPDVVVTDVMMPIMDGLQFCQALKSDPITSHIPVILLTARSTESQQIEGFERGADAYLTKPFHAQVLMARIYNLVKSRQQLRILLNDELRVKGEEIATTQKEPANAGTGTLTPRTQDRLFADALKEAIRNNMQNPNLKMDELGDELGLSRVQLYRKVKALTGLSPVELLRQMRLQRAYSLLVSTTKTVSEVAYEVGFGTPGYFSKCFKQHFGKYPTELRGE